MKLLSALVFFTCSAAAAHAADPFGNASSWTNTVDAAKPLRLEIAYGEFTAPSSNSPDTPPVLDSVTPEFLATAKTLRISLAPDDQGRVEMTGQLTAVYRLKTQEDAHSLDLDFALATDERHSATTSVTLPLNNWIVMSGASRTESSKSKKGVITTTRKAHVIAVRLTSSQP